MVLKYCRFNNVFKSQFYGKNPSAFGTCNTSDTLWVWYNLTWPLIKTIKKSKEYNPSSECLCLTNNFIL